MKHLLITVMIILAVGNVFAADNEGLMDLMFPLDSVPFSLLNSGADQIGSPALDLNKGVTAASSGELNPGKAMLLSAIIPGAGEMYAGENLKAAIFFAVEVAAWTGVIYYYGKGKDKEDEFMTFADANFDENAYRQYEYNLAQNAQQWNPEATDFTGTIEEWTDLEWDEKITYLPREGFTHELPTQEDRARNWSMDQQYYEMIGKYIHQFGFGWADMFDTDPGSPYYNGTSTLSLTYMDMRHDSNTLLKISTWGYNIALLNHVASALDASFSVRVMKRKAQADLSFRQVPYNNEIVPAGGLSIHW